MIHVLPYNNAVVYSTVTMKLTVCVCVYVIFFRGLFFTSCPACHVLH